MIPKKKSLVNLGRLKPFAFQKDDGTPYAYMDFIDTEGKLSTFRSALVITDGKGNDLEVWDIEEKDTYDLKITNIQN